MISRNSLIIAVELELRAMITSGLASEIVDFFYLSYIIHPYSIIILVSII